MLKSISGDFYFGICTTWLTSPLDLLVLDIIPFLCCVIIFSVCMLLATVKVFQWNREVAEFLGVDKRLRSLFNRLLLYNILQTTAVVVLVGDICYWYRNREAWSETMMKTFSCEMAMTTTNHTSPEDYAICIQENADLPKPSPWTYYIFSFCGLVSILGSIIFQCSFNVQQRFMNVLRNSAVSLWNLLTCKILYRTRARPVDLDYASSFTGMKREEITETEVILSFDSATSLCMLGTPPIKGRSCE